MPFLRNGWYCAAMQEDFNDKSMLARTILGEAVLLFKSESGEISAIGDRCPHRFAPLHMGRIIGDRVECPYHGLQFDKTGACAHSPHVDGGNGAAATVKSYPLVARDTLLWIWMGAPDKADPSRIPDYSHIGRTPPIGRMAMTIHVNSNYELMTDNILDLTHGDYVHADVLGNGNLSRLKPRFWKEGESINVEWFSAGAPMIPFMAYAMPDPTAPLDSWISVRWEAPASMYLQTGVTLAGRPREEGVIADALHLMTPVNEYETTYFAYATRNYELTEEFNVTQRKVLHDAFVEQDKPVVEAQQRMMGTADLWSLKPVTHPGDIGGVQARLALQRMIREEQELASGWSG